MTGTEQKYRLVIVDDEPYICNIVTEALSAMDNYEVIAFSDPQKAIDHMAKNRVDLVLTDLVMGDYSGITIFEQASRYHPDCIVILMTAYPTVDNAISVLRKGAYDYLVKPFKLETLRNAVKRGLEHLELTRENLHLKEQLALYRLSEAISVSTTLQSILNLAADTARSVIGVEGVSILVRNRASDVPVSYLASGESPDKESEKFLKGDHELCRLAMQELEAKVKSAEITGRKAKIRSLVAHPLMSRGETIGLLNVIQEDRFMPIKPGQLHLLSIVAGKVASAIENSRLYEHLQSSYLKAIKALANAIEARDRYTRGHTERVTVLADLIATRLGWSEARRAELKMGCTLHDIGKIGVPDAVLNKGGRLSEKEREQMNMHPILGAGILEGIDYLKPAVPYILYHHEKYDGTGYPHGLKGEDIPLEGRLLAVVDTYDAIVSDRPYREGALPEKAIAELKEHKGIQFDPVIVDILVSVWKEGLIDQLGIYKETEPARQAAVQ
jgi:response regulator RpfG family c-di-GMP phosphodiesterase